MVCILKLFSHLCSFVSSKNHFRHIYLKFDPIHTQRMCAHIHTSTHSFIHSLHEYYYSVISLTSF